MITDDDLTNWFSFHEQSSEQLKGYQEMRSSGLLLAQVIRKNTPPCADQTAAIRHVRDAVMTACAAVACKGR